MDAVNAFNQEVRGDRDQGVPGPFQGEPDRRFSRRLRFKA